ncbi:DUF4249 family protein [Poritiphilus flavus]|uniref:DUF4249 family protein n=1 Tax=Poritiphilus flavus TaxID=2697053 RepID=A0A6L9EBR0_9FLAO|nr:DUF4249 family protein [Poritiphilus flavus]NAS11991.1 DUF4249 family protein [Poritiphilus flavus]
MIRSKNNDNRRLFSKGFLFASVFAVLGSLSCEDVIDVETPSEPPRLIVNALMRVDTEAPFVPVEVRLSLTSNFFGDIPTTSADDNLLIIQEFFDEEGELLFARTSSLWENPAGSGIYEPDPNFTVDQRIPTTQTQSDVLYTLIIDHQGKRYAAQTRYAPSVPIDNLAIGDGTLFDEEETELIITYTDDPDRDNFYVIDFGFNEFLVSEDEFYKGQQFSFSYFYDMEFESGTELEVSILGADRNFHNYMNQLIVQSEDDQGPFQVPVATVRGNVFDITGLDNIDIVDNVGRPNDFPLGYFAIVQEFKASITVP